MKAVKATIAAAVMVAVLGVSAGAFAGQVAQRQNDNAQVFVSKNSPMMHKTCKKHCKKHHFHVGRHHFTTSDTKKMKTAPAAQAH